MMISKSVRSTISEYVSRHYRSYKDLPISDQSELVATILSNLDPNDKASILTDFDQNSLLPELVIRVIYSRGDFGTSKKLVDGLLDLFVRGRGQEKSAFYHDIEDAFDEEWGEQYPHESASNEHFLHDAIERANAARFGQGR